MSGGFQERLRRLRREEPASTPPVWLKQRLARRREEAAPPATSVPTGAGEPADLVVDGGVCARETLRPAADRHGGFELREVDAVDASSFTLLTGDAALDGLDPRSAVYLDTETTGLSGGAGTYVYMVGLGAFDGDVFRVWQGFLRGPEEEATLLAACADRIDAAEAVISFFGKSFDRHRLEDKMRAHGVAPPFARPHLDLYHPLARLTRGRLPDGRLGTLENALCGVERADDLPGALAPAAWFDYLAGRPHRLEGVFRHNLDDVLSLVTLTAHLGRVQAEARAGGAELAGCGAARARALGRAWLERGDREAALPWLDLALERAAEVGLELRDVELERAEALRLLGRLDDAAEAYVGLVARADDAHAVEGLVGWAKLLEHGRRDREGARLCCGRALELLECVPSERRRARLRADLERRLARL